MSRIVVSGLLNVETTAKVRKFPIEYYPIDYPFFGVHSSVAGVGYNVAKALKTLGDQVTVMSYLGKDLEAELILSELQRCGLENMYIKQELKETPASVVLYEENGRRQIYCDLKDIQDKEYPKKDAEIAFWEKDIVVLCNINFNRELLKKAKGMGLLIATDVHVVDDLDDEYNKEFMEAADLLFLSNEAIIGNEKQFVNNIKNRYNNRIIVLGEGDKGALMYERDSDTFYDASCVSVGRVVNTVGAGDALFSGFLHYFASGLQPAECLKRAELFASYKIGFNGAASGFADPQKIEELYGSNQVQIEILKE